MNIPSSIWRAVSAFAASLVLSAPAFATGSPDLVISQVYGGGGNTGATFTNDFIEIFNRGGAAVSLGGKSLQYTSATGTGNLGANANQLTVLPSVTLQPGHYFLVQEAAGSTPSGSLAADFVPASNAINMSATGGKVALVNATASLGCNGGSTACTAAQLALIIDLVGYDGANFYEGPVTTPPSSAAPTLSNTTAAIRNGGGCIDTDVNSADFAAGTPAPRNTSTPLRDCAAPTAPSISASASPASVSAGDSVVFSAVASPGAHPASTGLAVSGDFSSLGVVAGTLSFTDNGSGSFSAQVTVSAATSTGTKSIPVTVTDAQGRTGSTIVSLAITAPVPHLAIHDIQGPGDTSPYTGVLVQTEGIVTAVKSNGFFIQAAESDYDGDDNTSEGIFVFTSSAPNASIVRVGYRVTVRGKPQDFISSSTPNGPPVTEISGSPGVTAVAGGPFALPAPVTLTPADLSPTGSITQLSKYEGMRVHVDTLTAVAPSGGTINEVNATSTSNGSFFGVLPGTARPFREPGIEAPAIAPAGVPQFDGNPERLRVDTHGQVGTTALNIATGAVVSNLTGVLDFGLATYTVDPDPGTPPTVTNNDLHATPVRPPASEGEISIVSFNMERFYDTADDPHTSDVVLTTPAFDRRLTKASLVIRHVLSAPDIIGVEEMENLSTLQAVAQRVDDDAMSDGETPPGYDAYLFEGNDIGGIDVGFLVKRSRIDALSVDQVGLDTVFAYDGNLLNDRPPLVMTMNVKPVGKELAFGMTVIVNHLRSLSGIDDPVGGDRVRHKRLVQAEFLANLIQSIQAGGEKVVSLGDYNAFDVNDGLVDVISIVRGGPPHPTEDVLGETQQLVNPPLIDLAPADPAQHYSYSFGGYAQVLDHIIVSQSLDVTEFTYARNDADFPESLRNDATRPERISDHDFPVAYFSVPRDTVAPVVTLIGPAEGAFYSPAGVPAASCQTFDAASGVQTAATLVISGGATGPVTATCTGAVDKVGNAAADVSVHYFIDGTPPAVALNGPVNGTQYLLGTAPAASCSTTDADSGVAVPATLVISGGPVGAITATCTGATDNVGNVAADVSVHYTVVAYGFGGFGAPLNKASNTAKAGSTVPVKFQLFDWNGVLVTDTAVIVDIALARNAACAGTPDDGWQDASATGGTTLRFDPGAGQFMFNWKTSGLAPGCYAIAVKTIDTLTHATSVVIR